MRKRLLSTFLALCMVLSLLPLNVLAEDDVSAPMRTDEAETVEEMNGPALEDAESSATAHTEEVEKEGVTGEKKPEVTAEEDAFGSDIETEAFPAAENNSDNGILPTASGDIVASGECGDQGNNVTWVLDNAGTLTISGTGAMDDYSGVPFWGFSQLSIKNAVVADGVTRIGNSAFSECSNLTRITISNSVTSIGGSAFSGCGLKSVTIPSSVTSIGWGAFWHCDNLTSVIILGNITSIDGIFDSCGNLTSVTIPDSVTTIKSGTFYGCNKLSDIYYSGTKTQWSAISIDSAMNGPLVTATIHCSDGDMVLGNDRRVVASGECGTNATWAIDNTGTFTFSGTGETGEYGDTAEDGSWYGGYAVQPWQGNLTIKTVIVNNGITRVGSAAFEVSNQEIDSVTIPVSVTSIGHRAFGSTEKLTDVYYSGTMAQWKAITIGDFNTFLNSATIHCSDGNIKGSDSNPSGTASITQLYPSNGSTFDHAATTGDAAFHITFDREVTNAGGNRPALDFSVGTLQVHKASDDSVIYEVAESSFTAGTSTDVSPWGSSAPFTAISISGITPKLDYGTEYYVTMPTGFLKLADGTASPAIEKGQWSFTTAEEKIEENTEFSTQVEFRIRSAKEAKKEGKPQTKMETVSWDDKWFKNYATTYISELAITSIALSGASYVENEENGLPIAEPVKNALNNFGFDEDKIKAFNYSDSISEDQHYSNLTESDNDHVSYTFAWKEVENSSGNLTPLVAIVIKGTSENEEWYSNFNVGEYSPKNHLG